MAIVNAKPDCGTSPRKQLLKSTGRSLAADGTVETDDDKRFEFCDVYAFVGTTGNRLKKITSYMTAAD